VTSYAGHQTHLAPDQGLGRAVSGGLGHQGWWRSPVVVAVVVAALLHVCWWTLLSTSGGDIAAQDAWAEFARAHPGTAYSLEWYGGMHPVSYSVISPYVMAWLGVRTTMVLTGTLTAGLLAWLLQRSPQVRRPMWPAVYGAFALFGNAISGRVTFALGALFGLGVICLVLLARDQQHRWARNTTRLGVGACAALATMSSPVAGLFLGLVAVALWLLKRRADAYALGIPPVIVVAASAWLFPFSGEEPMRWSSAILPFIVPATIWLFVPREWREIRAVSAVYAVAVLLAWLLPSPIGTNIVRLGLLFGGVVLCAAVASGGWRTSYWAAWWNGRLGHARPTARTVLALALVTSTIWQLSVATLDGVKSRPSVTSQTGLPALVDQLRARHAELSRVEVVPTRNHSEAASLAPYVNLARGWNRQADVGRNLLFYKRDKLSPTAYYRWLRRWAVGYVVLSSSEPDPAAGATEQAVVASRPTYLHEVWSDGDWTLFQVEGARPLVDEPAMVTAFDAAMITVSTPEAGTFTLRIQASPWLALVDAAGKPMPDDALAGACLSAFNSGLTDDVAKDRNNWVVLHAPAPGTYRISAPYKLPRGSTCS